MPDGDWRKHRGFVFYEADLSNPSILLFLKYLRENELF